VTFLLLGHFPTTSLGFIESLSPSEQRDIDNGKSVVREESHLGSPWPTVVIYRNIGASPEKVLSLFSDYENAPRFAKNLRSAVVVETSPDQHSKTVVYTVNVPILPDISYKVKNTKSPYSGDEYRVDWGRVESELFSKIEGSLRIRPHRGGSIVRYQSSLTPASSIVSPLRGFVSREARQIMENFALLAESSDVGN
jgi:uncharacterized membrane protein